MIPMEERHTERQRKLNEKMAMGAEQERGTEEEDGQTIIVKGKI